MTSRSKRIAVWSSISVWVACACFAYLHLRPVGHNPVLVSVFAIMGITAFATVIARRRKAAVPVLVAIGAILTVGIYGSVLGAGNPGVLNGALVWIAAPVLYAFWVFAGTERLIKALFVTSAIFACVISVGILLYIGGKLGVIPQTIPLIIQDWGGFSFDTLGRNSTSISFYGLSTLVGAAPLWLTASVLPRHRLLPPKALSVAAAVTATLATMVSGRAALTVVTLVVPVVVWLIWRLISPRKSQSWFRAAAPFAAFAVVGGLIGALAAAGNTNVINAFTRVASMVTGDGQTASDRIRDVQAARLLEAWSSSPIVGHGLGATIKGFARSDSRPWDFELQYHLLLMQVGLLGTFVVGVAFAAAVIAVVMAVRRRPDMTPVVLVASSAAIAMAIANASNPYLQAPGHMWAMYLVLMVTNVVLTGESTTLAPPDSEDVNDEDATHMRVRS
jgi:hypothetical protein